MKLMGYRDGDMCFHPSLKGPGLRPLESVAVITSCARTPVMRCGRGALVSSSASLEWLRLAGLYPTAEAPSAFRNFIASIIDEWQFDNLCTAHNGNCISGKSDDTVLKLHLL